MSGGLKMYSSKIYRPARPADAGPGSLNKAINRTCYGGVGWHCCSTSKS